MTTPAATGAEPRPARDPSLKIAHVLPAFYPAHVYGGPIESAYQLCRHLALSGCGVRVLTTDANGRHAVLEVEKRHEVSILEHLSIRYCRRLLPESISPALLHQLLPYVLWADVVHLSAVYSFPTIPTLIACRLVGKPLVWSPRGALQRWKGSTRPGMKRVWERACAAVAPRTVILHVTSPEEARESLSRFPKFEAEIIPNGIEIPPRSTAAQASELRLLYIGRLHPKKGIENLLLACRILASGPALPFTLTIAGSGDKDYEEALRTRAADLAGADTVRMVGPVLGRMKEEVFAKADLVVVPSHTENFGLVVAESLARGVPVIASRGTPWGRIEEIGCGLWVDNRPESLAQAIETMARRPLKDMGELGRRWMEREFAWSAVAEGMKTLYLRAAASASRPH